jgi:N-acetyl-gamma-glutamylphosphate reductase
MAVQFEQLKSLESSSTKEAESAVKKVAVVGATGYTGQELVRLLLQHDQGADSHCRISEQRRQETCISLSWLAKAHRSCLQQRRSRGAR